MRDKHTSDSIRGAVESFIGGWSLKVNVYCPIVVVSNQEANAVRAFTDSPVL